MRSRVLFRDSAGLTLFLIGAVAVSLPLAAHADDVTPPTVPHDLQVPVGNTAFLVGHADGTQNYVCLPSSSGFAWTLFTPQATLFDDQDKELITHFFSPNPSESGTIRATWQHSRDASTVWAAAINNPVFVTKGAVPWLLLQVPPNGTREGPTGGATLTGTTFIQRVNTHGGVAAPEDCASSSDVGKKAFVPYTADYFFYKAASASDGQ